jgi:23S rRNA pseudouridine2605 synthase
VKTQAPVINVKPYLNDKEKNAEKNSSTQPEKAAAAPQDQLEGERIQKVLARGGIGSRREVERWLTEKRLQLNGEVAKLGARLKPGDVLFLNNRILKWEKFTIQPTRVLIYHKPTGEVVTRNDPENRKTIFTRLPKMHGSRWIAVGRLDINTQGLLLVTNNGELANRLMHPSSEIDREYAVRILGEVSEDNIAQLKKGVQLEDGLAHFDDIQFNGGDGVNKWYHVTVKEGRNRLVRRLWEALDFQVSRLMRVRYGPIFLPDGLSAGQSYELEAKELDDLLSFVDLPSERFAQRSKPRQHQKPKPAVKKNGKQSDRQRAGKSEVPHKRKQANFDKSNKRPTRNRTR